MESFYGGRPGASFVIVKQFDGINIPDESLNKYKYFAVDANEVPYSREYPVGSGNHELIERTGENYNLNVLQKALPLNGNDISTHDIADPSQSYQVSVPEEQQEGMIQCFSKGAGTTGKVNYGEYVIIDTFDKNNPDNGKVFRRGINFTGDLCGAEYIGQIVGPQGGVSDIDLVQQDDVPEGAEGGYQSASEDKHSLIPGQDGTNYNDKIYYKYKDFRDVNGVISTFKVGFQIPYLVHEFTGAIRSPYNNGVPIDDTFNLIEKIEEEEEHPFYQGFKINVPQGFKGDTPSNFEIFPTVVNEAPYQNNAQLSGPASGIITGLIKIDTYYDTKTEYSSAAIVNSFEEGSSILGYVSLNQPEDNKYLYEYHLGCLLTRYDEHEAGDSKQIDLGPYRDIDSVNISAAGVITVNYTCGSPQTLDTVIEYPISLTVGPDGSMTTLFNTGKSTTVTKLVKQLTNVTIENSSPEGVGNDYFKAYYNDGSSQYIQKATENYPINFIDKTAVNSNNGQLLVRYTNPASRGTVQYGSNDDQKEVGLVKGESGGVRIVKQVSSYSELIDSATGNGIAPENFSTPPDYSRVGWCVTVENPSSTDPSLYWYDYNNLTWRILASMVPSTADPITIIGFDYNTLAVNGVQLIASQRKSV